MGKFFLEVAKGLMCAVPFLTGYALYRDPSDQMAWFLIAAEGILIAIVFVPWGSLSFGHRQQVAYNYAASTQPAVPSQAQHGPGIFHNLGTNMKPIGFGIVGALLLLVACGFGFTAFYADEPLVPAAAAFVAFVVSVLCFLAQAKELKAFAINSKAQAWGWMLLSLFAVACFYMYANQEGGKWYKSLGYWLSWVSVFLAFLATQGKLVASLGWIGNTISGAYAMKYGMVVGLLMWLGTALLSMAALYSVGKFDAFEDSESAAALTELGALAIWVAVATVMPFAGTYILFKLYKRS